MSGMTAMTYAEALNIRRGQLQGEPWPKRSVEEAIAVIQRADLAPAKKLNVKVPQRSHRVKCILLEHSRIPGEIGMLYHVKVDVVNF